MQINEEEFLELAHELYKVGRENKIPREVLMDTISTAIRRRLASLGVEDAFKGTATETSTTFELKKKNGDVIGMGAMNTAAVLYAPPMLESVEVAPRSLLYAPPPMPEVHTVDPDEWHYVDGPPGLLYAPPPITEVEVRAVDPGKRRK
jgi:hypothetical protein